MQGVFEYHMNRKNAVTAILARLIRGLGWMLRHLVNMYVNVYNIRDGYGT